MQSFSSSFIGRTSSAPRSGARLLSCAVCTLALFSFPLSGYADEAPLLATATFQTSPKTNSLQSSRISSLLAQAQHSPIYTLQPIARSTRLIVHGTEETSESTKSTFIAQSTSSDESTLGKNAAEENTIETGTETENEGEKEESEYEAESTSTTDTVKSTSIEETPESNEEETVAEMAQAPAPISAPAPTPKLYAPSISYRGGTIIAAGTEEEPVRLEGGTARITAQNLQFDTVNRVVNAQGQVQVEREVTVKRYATMHSGRKNSQQSETVTETLKGENFEYHFETQEGSLGATEIRLANFNITAESLLINGQKYTAHNVVVRPGGLSEEEIKTYGTPPFNLRLREFTVDTGRSGSAAALASGSDDDEMRDRDTPVRAYGRGGALYFKNTRILPVPSALLGRAFSRREQSAFQLTPRISYNSADGLLATARIFYPLSRQDPTKRNLAADIGASTKVGFRGGLEVNSRSKLGDLSLRARISDVVVSQLTNRIELDRLPEVRYAPPAMRLLNLPGGRQAGLRLDFTAGDYRERFGDGSIRMKSSRLHYQALLTTRLARKDGPYLDLFTRTARYSDHYENQQTTGFEIGYTGRIIDRVSGQFSYSASHVSGSTPFRFDRVEIKNELRATFDVMLTPRYIMPFDFRYDIDKGRLRDSRIGILRNYKTFAYGLTYQSARNELKLEIRQGF